MLRETLERFIAKCRNMNKMNSADSPQSSAAAESETPSTEARDFQEEYIKELEADKARLTEENATLLHLLEKASHFPENYGKPQHTEESFSFVPISHHVPWSRRRAELEAKSIEQLRVRRVAEG